MTVLLIQFPTDFYLSHCGPRLPSDPQFEAKSRLNAGRLPKPLINAVQLPSAALTVGSLAASIRPDRSRPGPGACRRADSRRAANQRDHLFQVNSNA